MTTYYISPSGSNSNNGLGPDASHATNKPWLTLAKALGTGSSVVPGDLIVVGPGIYYQSDTECTVIAGISSVAVPTTLLGDPKNKYGFKDGSGVRLSRGPCFITMRSNAAGLDTILTSSNWAINYAAALGLKTSYLVIEGGYDGNGAAIGIGNGAVGCVFENVDLRAYQGFACSGAPIAGRNWTVRQFMFTGDRLFAWDTTTAATTANADLGILFESGIVIGRLSQSIGLGATAGNKAGGVSFQGISVFIGMSTGILTTRASQVSTTVPIHVGGCKFYGGGPALIAGTSGQIIDDGDNQFWTNAANTNVTDGTRTVRGAVPAILLPSALKSELVQNLNDVFGWDPYLATDAQRYSAWPSTAYDYRGILPRPLGPGASVGHLEAQKITKETGSVITGGGANSARVWGAGFIRRYVPVDPAATTISVITESSSYGGTNYPQIVVMANPDIGITSDQTGTATSATEQTIATPSFTPTAKGVVEIRLISRSNSTASSTWFDTLTVP